MSRDLNKAILSMRATLAAMSRQTGDHVPEDELRALFTGIAIATGVPGTQLLESIDSTVESCIAAIASGAHDPVSVIRGACMTNFVVGVYVGEQKP